MSKSQEVMQSKELISPFEAIFKEIEVLAQSQELSAQDAYEYFLAALAKNNLDPRVYLSMSITSGGFARDESLGFGDVIGNNSQFGTRVKHSLLNEYPELTMGDMILPSELGKVKGWGQADFCYIGSMS